jgi:hypothetical protein
MKWTVERVVARERRSTPGKGSEMHSSLSFVRGVKVALPVARDLALAALAVFFPHRRSLRFLLLYLAPLSASLFLTGCGGNFSLVQSADMSLPAITGVKLISTSSPNSKLDIIGKNFTPGTTSSWGATPLKTSYFSTTRLRVAVPVRLIATSSTISLTVSTSAGTANAMVTTTGGASPEVQLAAPVITGLSPASINAGNAALTLTINGKNFTSAATSSWGDISLTTTYVSATELTAVVPASLIATAGTANVTVTTAGGTSSVSSFTILPPLPTITSLSSTSVVQGSEGFTLTVNGANYLSGTSATVVTWNSTALTTTYVNSTQLTAVVPASLITSAGTASIAVVTAGGSSSAVTFTISPAQPVITGLSPSKISAGYGDFTIFVYGNYFTSTATINWNSTALVTSLEAGHILQAAVPASLTATAGTVSITVTTAGGVSAPMTFTVAQPLPVITSLSPTSIAAGSAKFILTINGTNFNSKSQVCVQSTWLAVTYLSATQLTVSVPANLIATAGTASVIVYNSGIGTSSAATFTINPAPPAITSLSPSSVTAGSAGFMMTVTGTAFTSDAAVTWGASSLETTYVSATQLKVSVPASLVVDSGTVSITVSTSAGTSSVTTFTIDPAPPSISGLSPSQAMAGGAAFTLTIRGGYFTSDAIVKWESTVLATTYVSDTELVAVVPADLIATAGTASITVSTSAGTSASAVLTVNSGIGITTTALPSGTAGNAYSGPINVTGGVPGYNWTVTGLPDDFTYFNTNGSRLTITGTPSSSGTTTVQISVADTMGNSAGPVSYTMNIGAGPDGSNNANLNGRYVCLSQGFIDDDSSRWAFVYSFQADGQGNFTSGVLDTNSHDIGSALGTVSGTYSIGADNNGVASIHTVLTDGAAGIQTTQWSMAITSAAQPAEQFRMIENDDLGTLPSGLQGTANCYLATPSAFSSSTLSGHSFVFGLEGEDNSGNMKASAGLFRALDGKIVSGIVDTAEGGGATVQSSAFTGSYTAPDATTGRFTVSLSGAGNSTGLTVYMIDANRMFVLDSTSNDGEQAGNLRTQQQTTYSAANLSGLSVLYTRGAEFTSDSSTPSGFYARLIEQTGDGAGGLTVNQSYANDNGVYSAGSAKGQTSAFVFDSGYPGRVTSSSDSGDEILYLFDDNSAIAMDVNVDGSLDSGSLEPQTQSAVNSTAIAISALYGELPQLSASANANVGEFNLTANGAITAALSTAGQGNASWDQSSSMTYSVDATASGTGTFSIVKDTESKASCAVLNAAKLVCVSQTDSAPTIELVEQN